MRKWGILLSFVFTAMVASTVSIFGMKFWASQQMTSQDSHQWIHRQFRLTKEQDLALSPIENKYQLRKKELMREMSRANHELAIAILTNPGHSPSVDQAAQKVHFVMGELQKLTLDHVFEMKTVLTQEQFDKLIKLTAEALKTTD